MIKTCPSFAAVVREPRDDAPRLHVAQEISHVDYVRARLITSSIAACSRAARAIEEQRFATDEYRALRRETGALLREHGVRWRKEDGVGGWVMRGFVESADVGPVLREDVATALAEWPVLHLDIHGSLADQAQLVRDAIARMVTLELHDADDAGVEHLLATYDLARLRKLTLRGPITERSLHALCTAPLPMLEELVVDAPGLRNPCETAETDDWAQLVTFAQRSELGQALERQYGWKKFLHGPSRFSIYPYPIEVLDILPPLPERLKVLPRLWHPASSEPPDDV